RRRVGQELLRRGVVRDPPQVAAGGGLVEVRLDAAARQPRVDLHDRREHLVADRQRPAPGAGRPRRLRDAGGERAKQPREDWRSACTATIASTRASSSSGGIFATGGLAGLAELDE